MIHTLHVSDRKLYLECIQTNHIYIIRVDCGEFEWYLRESHGYQVKGTIIQYKHITVYCVTIIIFQYGCIYSFIQHTIHV